MNIEFEYSDGDGHVWLVRCDRSRLADAADAAFRWFATVDNFGARHLGVFLAAILGDAVSQGTLSDESYQIVSRVIHAVPHVDASHATKVNLIREIVHAALSSGA